MLLAEVGRRFIGRPDRRLQVEEFGRQLLQRRQVAKLLHIWAVLRTQTVVLQRCSGVGQKACPERPITDGAREGAFHSRRSMALAPLVALAESRLMCYVGVSRRLQPFMRPTRSLPQSPQASDVVARTLMIHALYIVTWAVAPRRSLLRQTRPLPTANAPRGLFTTAEMRAA